MAEKTASKQFLDSLAPQGYEYGLPGSENAGILTQIGQLFVPARSAVITPPKTEYTDVDGAKMRVSTPGKYADPEFGISYMPIVQGVGSFASALADDPLGVGKAMLQGLAQVPGDQYKAAQGMSQGLDFVLEDQRKNVFEDENLKEIRFDPTLVPTAMAIGSAKSIAQVADDGSTVIGMMGGRKGASGVGREQTAKSLKAMGKDPDTIFRATSSYFDEDVLGSDSFRYEIPTKDAAVKPELAKTVEIDFGPGEAFGLDRSVGQAFITSDGNMVLGGGKPARLQDVLDFPTLYEEYPQLRDVQVVRIQAGPNQDPNTMTDAFYSAADDNPTGKPLIGMYVTRDQKQFTSNLLHEAQHAIQDFEGFEKGANYGVILEMLEERYPDANPQTLALLSRSLYQNVYGEGEARTVQTRFENPELAAQNPVKNLRGQINLSETRLSELDAVDSIDEEDIIRFENELREGGVAGFAPLLSGKGTVESRAPASNTNVTKFGFYQDNPDTYRGNNEYTQSNASYVERTMPEGSDYLRGPQTAILGRDMSQTYAKGPKQEKPLMLPAELLHRIPGSMHEARSARNPDAKYDRLSETVAEEGFDRGQSESGGVIVGVNHLGQAYIIEGNTRAALAFDQGIPSIKAEVRYYNGGEMVDGPFSPQRMAAYSDFGIQTGGTMFSESRTRFADPVSAVDLGGGRQGIAGLAHGVKRGQNTDKKVQIKVADLQRVNESLQEPAQDLMKYAEDNNLIGPDGNIFIDRAELITVTGLDNRIRKAFLKATGAKSAEVDREGFSLSGDPFLSYKEFAGEAPTRREMDQLLVAETFNLARGDVQDLSPAEYLMAEYNPSARVLKKPNTKFFEDESHVGKDSQNYINMRAMTDTERKRFRNIADRNTALLSRAQDSYNKFYKSSDGIFELARNISKGHQGIEGVHQKRNLELYTIAPLAIHIEEPAVRKALINSLGNEEARELFGLLQVYKNARTKAVNDNLFNQEVLVEHANVVKQIYGDDLAQTHPDFAKDLQVDSIGERGETFMGFRFDPRFKQAGRAHSRALQSGEGIEETTKALEAFPMHKRVTFVDDDGVLKFRGSLQDYSNNRDRGVKMYFDDIEQDIEVAMRHVNAVRKYEGPPDGKKLLVEKAIQHIDNSVPMAFADPLKQMIKTSETAREKARVNINNRPKASEFNQAYRDYQNATQAVVDKFAQIADHGPNSPLFNYVGPNKPAIEGRGYALQGPERKFKNITVRDNPAVKFEDGGPVRAGIAEFIRHMVR